MTLNEVNIIKNSVLDATEAYVDARLNSSDFVKTQIGVVTASAKGSDNKYRHTVVCNRIAGVSAGITYTNVLSVGNIQFPNNSVVFIIIPNAQASNQFILGKLDTSPCNIEGGEIHIGKIGTTSEYYFNVNSTGNVTIKGEDSSIQLAQHGNYYHVNLDKDGIRLGHTTGNNYNFTVDASTGSVAIKSGSINIANKFYADNQGNLYVGGTNTNANFYVDNTGKVTIKSGSINIANKFYADSTGNLYVGGTNTSANFYVDNTGGVTIKKGSMTINNLFKVDTSGNLYVGGINTSANFYVQASDGSVTIKRGSINIGNGQFEVSATGDCTCKNLTANNSGSIGGFKITSNALGDSLGSANCVGMISGDKLFAWNSAGYTYMNYRGIESENGTITLTMGGSKMEITHSNIHCDNYNSNVVWHSELSDKRYKKDIKEISPNKIRNFFKEISPSSFKFNKKCKDKDNLNHYGIIAQNLQYALKQAKLKDENIVKLHNNKMLVDYQELHGLELAGIKDLYREVELLKSKLGV